MTEGPQQGKGRESGLTLIELLVSMTILAFILAGLGASLRMMGSGWERSLRRAEHVDMVTRAAAIFRRDIEALQRVVLGEGGSAAFLFSGSPDALTFAAVEPPYPSRRGLFAIAYGPGPDGDGIALFRAHAPLAPETASVTAASLSGHTPILDRNFSWRFAYAMKTESGWVWHEEWPFRQRMPALIRLTIAGPNGQPAAPDIVAAIRPDAELACIGGDELCSASTGELRARNRASGSAEQ